MDNGTEKATQHGQRIFLDISRLLAAGRRSTPSGIERVEMAYAQRFRNHDTTRFVACFLGHIHFLPPRHAAAFIEALENSWEGSGRAVRIRAMSSMALLYARLFYMALFAWARTRKPISNGFTIYLSLSHENLTAGNPLINFKSRTGAKLLFLVHDLIPITHPEYARPGHAKLHRQRMNTVAALADVVLVNSAATANGFRQFLKESSRVPEMHVVHLGIASIAPVAACKTGDTPTVPYFIMLATIEPRKNHLLLLNLWRGMASERIALPRLIIVGRRGWENEMVVDMLERCTAIAGMVEERPDVSDETLRPLLQGARALLLPSFAEGYGLPVAEALAAGTPVICSNLPALREIGGEVPEYLDPLDGPAWRSAILAYAETPSPRRAAQCERMRNWAPPSWERHFERVSAILEGLDQAGGQAA